MCRAVKSYFSVIFIVVVVVEGGKVGDNYENDVDYDNNNR